MNRKKISVLGITAFIVLLIDQYTKWLIRTTPSLQNYTIIDGWLEFYYTQNPGMALGIEILSTPVISSIAIAATLGIIIYIMLGIKESTTGYLVCMGLIIGGALGNISDRIFIGLIEGYGGVLEGHVVDFIYFSLRINDWTVFPYIFNVADVAISIAIISLLVFNKWIFIDHEQNEAEASKEPDNAPDISVDIESEGGKEGSSSAI
ncbi:MAG: signal peptidase II [Balneolaceae bacterium]|nr:signal peptidase II [Balneolaceae bacterium]